MTIATKDWNKTAQTANALLTKAGMTAVLRRSSGDRNCIIVISRFTPIEMMGGLVQAADRKIIIPALSLIDPITNFYTPPDMEQDRLITYVQPVLPGQIPTQSENLRIVKLPERISAGGIDIAWILQVRR